MGGVPLDVVDKLKALFKRKPKGGAAAVTNGTAGTKTETPKASETAPAMPEPSKTDTAAAPSSSEPGAPPAGAAPIEESKADTPADPVPAAAPEAAAEAAPASTEEQPKVGA